jgi:hypothetical protein
MATDDGLGEVMHNLNEAIAGIERRTQRGLLTAALFIEGEAVKNAPINIGNLRGSSYVYALEDGAEVGFESDYAVYVHEVDNDYGGGEWKYLQRAVDENTSIILDIIRKDAEV